MLTVIGLAYSECDIKRANGYLPFRSSKCLKSSSFSFYIEQCKLQSAVIFRFLVKLNCTDLFEMVRAFVILLPKGMIFFFFH